MYSKFYVEKDFLPNRVEAFYDEDLLNSDYKSFRKIMVGYKIQGAWVVEELSVYGFDMYQAKVVFTTNATEYRQNYGGACKWEWESKTPEDGLIEIYHYSAYTHEYVHLLAGPQTVDSWLCEALAYYCSERKSDVVLNYLYASCKEEYEKGEQVELHHVITEYLGRPFDLSKDEEWLMFLNVCTVFYDKFDGVKASHGGGTQKIGFVSYLIELVGEENAIKSLLSGDAESIFGKSWEELQSDWKAKCLEDYSWAIIE